jgi:ElaB/YqjD/DUF883 family membrane-anchored ribosome-binding protein
MKQNLETAEAPAKDGLLNKGLHVAEKVARAGYEVERLKARASHAVEDGTVAAKRMIKRGRYAAEDLREETAHRIKRDPFRAVLVTFGVGVGVGIAFGSLVGLLAGRKLSGARKD